jgi:hypothetical protein
MVVIESFSVVEGDHMWRYFNNGGKAAAGAAKLRFGLSVGVT